MLCDFGAVENAAAGKKENVQNIWIILHRQLHKINDIINRKVQLFPLIRQLNVMLAPHSKPLFLCAKAIDPAAVGEGEHNLTGRDAEAKAIHVTGITGYAIGNTTSIPQKLSVVR
jgi:hypothetical protein